MRWSAEACCRIRMDDPGRSQTSNDQLDGAKFSTAETFHRGLGSILHVVYN
jgi:hypothetical protein